MMVVGKGGGIFFKFFFIFMFSVTYLYPSHPAPVFT